MERSPYIFDATAENFRSLVLENSEKGPVLVNYWSPRAGPCMMLMPRLIRLTGEFGGRFLLVMLNTDELGRLAREHGVTSLPTVKVFRRGKAVDTLHGAESEPALRQFVNKHVTPASDVLHAEAIQSYQRRDVDRAVSLAAQAALADPENFNIPLDVAKLLVLQGRYAQAEDLLNSLPHAAKEQREIQTLATHLGFIRVSQGAPSAANLEQTIARHPDDLDARYQLSAVRVVQDDYEAAMAQLLEIVRHDAQYRLQIGRKGLLAIFEMLGEEDERVRRYRALLLDAMH